MSVREIAIAAPLVVMAVVLGIFPKTLLNYTDATINGLVDRLNPARHSALLSPSAESRNAVPGELAKPQAGGPAEIRNTARNEVTKAQAAVAVTLTALEAPDMPPIAKASP
jgi:hypothetical protein